MDYTDRIKALMKFNKIRQEEMAELTGMSESSFRLKLNRKGNRKFDIDEAIRVVSVLGVTLDQIFLAQKVTI